jgi:hypothetical protein
MNDHVPLPVIFISILIIICVACWNCQPFIYSYSDVVETLKLDEECDLTQMLLNNIVKAKIKTWTWDLHVKLIYDVFNEALHNGEIEHAKDDDGNLAALYIHCFRQIGKHPEIVELYVKKRLKIPLKVVSIDIDNRDKKNEGLDRRYTVKISFAKIPNVKEIAEISGNPFFSEVKNAYSCRHSDQYWSVREANAV